MLGTYTPDGELSESHFKKFKRIKHAIYITSFILFLVSLAMIAGCVYMLVEWSFLDDIMNYDIPNATFWIMIMAGSLTVLFVPVTSCYGAYTESKCLLLTNIGFLAGTFLVLLSGAVCAIVWQTQIGLWVSLKMEKSLKETYGVDLDNNFNRFITQQWDQAQEKMKCCGVRNEGWGIYRQSRWYAEQPYIQDGYQETFYGSDKPMVPESCCKLGEKGRIYNRHKCQRFRDGPPYSPQDDADTPQFNNALYYRGCYEQARLWIDVFATSIMAIGIGFALFMLICIVLSIVLLLMLRE